MSRRQTTGPKRARKCDESVTGSPRASVGGGDPVGSGGYAFSQLTSGFHIANVPWWLCFQIHACSE